MFLHLGDESAGLRLRAAILWNIFIRRRCPPKELRMPTVQQPAEGNQKNKDERFGLALGEFTFR